VRGRVEHESCIRSNMRVGSWRNVLLENLPRQAGNSQTAKCVEREAPGAIVAISSGEQRILAVLVQNCWNCRRNAEHCGWPKSGGCAIIPPAEVVAEEVVVLGFLDAAPLICALLECALFDDVRFRPVDFITNL
jgi:hypothetical protein